MSEAKRELVEGLRRGNHLYARFTRSGRISDFELRDKRGRVVRVVPRVTIAGLCATKKSGRHKAHVAQFQPKPITTPIAPRPPAPAAEAQLLEDIARGMAGKAFARLNSVDQATIRQIAERIG